MSSLRVRNSSFRIGNGNNSPQLQFQLGSELSEDVRISSSDRTFCQGMSGLPEEGGGVRRDCRRPKPDDFPSGDGNRAVPPPR